MAIQRDLSGRLGAKRKTTTVDEPVSAYVPKPLPPSPPIDIARLLGRLEKANLALGRLDGIASILPSTRLFVFMYVRKEALLSSQIEGTQSSLSDLLLFENHEEPFVPLDDVQEVSTYIAAMTHGLDRMAGGFPLSLRLIKEMHEILLKTGRGSGMQPGEFRRSQNWIGGTRPGNALFVPSPHELVDDCMGALEIFLHDRQTYPILIRAALAHVQFETIHPFLDGNGRIGRLLITLLLCEGKVISEPLLYLSLHLKTHRNRYYDLLQLVRETGDWESWIEFFLDGVLETAQQGVSTARRLQALLQEDRHRINGLGRASPSALRLHDAFQLLPIMAVPEAAKRLATSQPTVQKSLEHMQALGIIKEVTGKRRNRIYRYSRYLDILDEGTEPLPRK